MSFDAYKISIKLSLVNNMTAGLAAVAGQFIGLNKHIAAANMGATEFEKRMGSIKRLTLVGGAMAGAGVGMLMSIKGPIEQAMEWERESAKLRQMGLGNAQIADAQKFVQATNIIGTSMQQRMKLFTEAQGAFRESGMSGAHALEAAKVMSPVLAQYQVASGLLGGPHQHAVDGAMMQMNKTVELLGGLNDPKKALAIAEGVFKAVQSSGKMVSERDLKQFVVQGGTAVAGLSEKTIFAALEPIIGEFGGSITGTGMQTAFNRTHGILSKPPKIMVNEMLRLSLWDKSKLEFNSQGGIKAMHGSPMVKDMAKLQESDTLGFLLRMMAIYKSKGIESIADVARENEIVFGRTGGRIYTKAMQQIEVMRRSVDAYEKSQGISATNRNEAKSPMMAMTKFHKSLEDLGLVVGQTVLPVLTPLISGMTDLLKGFQKRPDVLRELTIGFVGLGVAMSIGGTIMLARGAFNALGMAMKFSDLGGAAGIAGTGKSLGAVAKGIGALQWAGAAFLAWQAGQAAGSFINEWLNKGAQKRTGNKDETWGGELYDRLHGGNLMPKGDGSPPVAGSSRAQLKKSQEEVERWRAERNLVAPMAIPPYMAGRTTAGQPLNAMPKINVAPKLVSEPLFIATKNQPAKTIFGRDTQTGASPYMAPPASNHKQAINNKIVMPDGRVLANVVTEVQAREASRPGMGSTRFDGSMSPVSPSLAGAY